MECASPSTCQFGQVLPPEVLAIPSAEIAVRFESLDRAREFATMKYLEFKLLSGASMPRQGAEALAQRMQAGGLAHAERVLVNMLEGKMFVEFRANSREDLEAWLKTEGMHFDSLVRIEWEMHGDKLRVAE